LPTTPESTSRPHDWNELYRLALTETDPAKQTRRISEARKAIFDRIQEAFAEPSNSEEREQLTTALNGLRTVQQEYERRIQQFGEPRTSLRKSA
jgi:hypothetical protein